MLTIPLTQGRVAIIDDEDFEALTAHKWYAARDHVKHCEAYYAARKTRRPDGGQTTEPMHRVVLVRKLGRSIDAGLECDHENGDRLDNRRENLREAKHRLNGANRHHQKTSRFIGSSWNKRIHKWRAYTNDAAGKQVHLGFFATELEAALARDAYITAHPELGAQPNFQNGGAI